MKTNVYKLRRKKIREFWKSTYCQQQLESSKLFPFKFFVVATFTKQALIVW